MAIFSIFSTTMAFLCSSHGKPRKPARKGESSSGSNSSSVPPAPDKRVLLKIQSSLSSKALLKMISWRKVHEENIQDNDFYMSTDGEDDEEALWRKTIMKGEKCRPIDFSGQIVYDSRGNLQAS